MHLETRPRTTRFKINRLRQRIRNSRYQAKTYEEIAEAIEDLMTGEGDLRDETLYDETRRQRRNADEMWQDHNEAVAELKALS